MSIRALFFPARTIQSAVENCYFFPRSIVMFYLFWRFFLSRADDAFRVAQLARRRRRAATVGCPLDGRQSQGRPSALFALFPGGARNARACAPLTRSSSRREIYPKPPCRRYITAGGALRNVPVRRRRLCRSVYVRCDVCTRACARALRRRHRVIVVVCRVCACA